MRFIRKRRKMQNYQLTAPCHFGLEAVCKREIYDLGYEITKVEDGRVTFAADAEGICRAAVNGTTGVVVEVNSETDFVAKNEIFQTFVQQIADQALASSLVGGKDGEDVEALLGENGLKEALVDKTATIGEKLSFRRFQKLSGDVVVDYLHGNGRIGVIVAGNGASDDAAKEALKNVAMQIAAMSPQYISREDISDDELAKMREITIDSALNDVASLPKPIQKDIFAEALSTDVLSAEDKAILEEKQNDKYLFNFLSKEAIASLAAISMSKKEEICANKIFNGLVEGRISKQLKEVCLLDQTYVMAADGKQTVKAYLAEVSKEVGATVALKSFVRFETGEGIEKKEEDFAAEVAKQMQ